MTDNFSVTPQQQISSIILNIQDEPVIRIDAEGFHYRDQFIADAGEAHRLLVEYLRQHQPQRDLANPNGSNALTPSAAHWSNSMTDFRALCVELVDDLEEWVDGFLINDPADQHTDASFELINRARAALAEADGPTVSDGREPASVTDQITHQLHRRATVLLIRKVIEQALRDTASVQWRVADTGEQLVRASDLLAWAEHMEKQMEQLDD